MIIKKKVQSIEQSYGEEIANAITHGAGFILSLLGLIILIYNSALSGTMWHVVSTSLYGITLLLLFLISTLYHSITHPTAKTIFRKLDHISIFLLIAGTYMPLTLVALNGPLGWFLFSLQWAFSLIGIIFKVCCGHRYEIASLILYLLMGWVAIFAIKPIMIALSLKGFMWILYGGIFYTIGVLFFVGDKKFQYFHAVWHVFVLLGSACHFVVVLFYIIPIPVL
jgi:hemolysin III